MSVIGVTRFHRFVEQVLAIVESPLTSTVLTLSMDRSLKCWEVRKRKLKLRSWYTLQSSPRCMDVHPTCFMVAVGFIDVFRIYVLTEELNTLYQTQLKHCNNVRFSREGTLLALTYQQDNLRILNAYTLQAVIEMTFT